MRSVKFQKCVRRILASSFHRCVGARCVSVVFVCGTVLFVFVTVFLCFGTVFCVFGTRIVVGIARVLSAAVVRARIREHEHTRANAHACAHTTDQGALSFVVLYTDFARVRIHELERTPHAHKTDQGACV